MTSPSRSPGPGAAPRFSLRALGALVILLTCIWSVYWSSHQASAKNTAEAVTAGPSLAPKQEIIRIGVIAPSYNAKMKDQGCQIRTDFMKKYINGSVYGGVMFQVKTYYCEARHKHMADIEDCADVDILYHIQKICRVPLQQCSQVAHILDQQDRPIQTDPEDAPLYKLFDGNMLISHHQAESICSAKFCLVHQTPFDLQVCRHEVSRAQRNRAAAITRRPFRTQQSRSKTLVGLVGNAKVYGTLAQALERANIPYIREAGGHSFVKNTCEFFSKITVAIAWSPFIYTNESNLGEYGKLILTKDGEINQTSIDYWYNNKPAERFTNPLMLNIPTIGFKKYASVRSLDADELLCETDACAVALIGRLERGELNNYTKAVQERVKTQVNPFRTAQLNREFFIDVLSWRMKQNRMKQQIQQQQQLHNIVSVYGADSQADVASVTQRFYSLKK